MASSDSWEEAFETENQIQINEKLKLSIQDKTIDMIYTFNDIFNELFKSFIPPQISESIDYNIKSRLTDLLISKEDPTNLIANINLFKSLNSFNILCRIYFVFDKTFSSFIECCINNEIIQYTEKWNGCVFYVDSSLQIEDYSWWFSRNFKSHSIFAKIIKKLKNIVTSNPNIQIPTAFDNLDLQRKKILPNSIAKFLKHPFYILPSQLRHNQAIVPKRPICGYYKGEPIYLKQNVIKLRSQNQFYKLGKEIISERPFKQYNNISLYSEFQVKDIEIENMSDKISMDYFHDNHIPKNCLFIENESAEYVCRQLGIEYRRCFRGFERGLPVYLGIFVYKKDLLVFSHFLAEYLEHLQRTLENEEKLTALCNWKKIFKTTSKFLDIRRKLGLENDYEELD